VWLVLETVGLAGLLAAIAAGNLDFSEPARLLAMIAAGCWIHRIYVVGHEAVHRKLFPNSPHLNDFIGQLLLLIMLVPLPVYRKIHFFHHGHNRRDPHTSALDIYVVPPGAGRLRRGICQLLWFISVFCGGFFIHSVVSIILFLCLPLRIAQRVSPAFRGWTADDRLRSWVAFIAGISLHTLLVQLAGWQTWARTCGYPMLVFAWVYSLFVYIYHYRTEIGAPTHKNVRSLRRNALVARWLLNFHEHTAHHRDPSLPWYALPRAGASIAPGPRLSIWRAVGQQLRGPTIRIRGEEH